MTKYRPDARSRASPLARVARDAGCTPTSVYQWMRRYRSEGTPGLMDARNAPMPAEPMPAAGDDVEELRRQVEALRLENAVMRETINVLKADDPRLDESDPLVVSEKVVRRIMREGAMRPVYLKRPKRWSSYAGEIGEAPANLVGRDFHAEAPNMLWVCFVKLE